MKKSKKKPQKPPKPIYAYYIMESKQMVFTYQVYAKTQAEALRKFRAHECEEIGLDAGRGKTLLSVREMGPAVGRCTECREAFYPQNLGDYRCPTCEKERGV